jgi:DNA-binding MarR family transcriptional regulator
MAKQSQTSQQAEQLARLTRDLSRCCQTKEEQIFARFGLSPADGRVLLVIAEGVVATPSHVAAELKLGRSRLTPLVESLVEKGLLERREEDRDRRVRRLMLTPQGQRIALQVTDFQREFHTSLLQKFNLGERGELLTVLQHLHDAIEDLRDTISAP